MGELPVHQHRNALTKLAQVQRLRLQQHIRDPHIIVAVLVILFQDKMINMDLLKLR